MTAGAAAMPREAIETAHLACGRSPQGVMEPLQGDAMCAYCGEELGRKRCSWCKSVCYCSRRCQKRDWVSHRNVCNPFHITVRLLSGEALEIQTHPSSLLNDLKGKVFLWAFNRSNVEDFDLFEIDLILHGIVLENDMSTLMELGVSSGDELQLIGHLETLPALVHSDSDF
jgi:hypothetical protein